MARSSSNKAGSILEYQGKEADSPLRYQIARSILTLRDNAAGISMRQVLPTRSPDVNLKKQIKAEQDKIAKPIYELKDSLKELIAAGEKHRDGENKRVQALYDYLVLRLSGKKKLAVFDVQAGKVVKELPLAEEVAHVAGGANRLVVLYPNARLLVATKEGGPGGPGQKGCREARGALVQQRTR